MFKINSKYIKYIRPAIAVFVLLLGAVFMLVPFIPLGYILLAIGLILLVPYIGFLSKWLDKLKKKDKRNRIDKAEKILEKSEDKLYNKFTDKPEKEKEQKKKNGQGS